MEIEAVGGIMKRKQFATADGDEGLGEGVENGSGIGKYAAFEAGKFAEWGI